MLGWSCLTGAQMTDYLRDIEQSFSLYADLPALEGLSYSELGEMVRGFAAGWEEFEPSPGAAIGIISDGTSAELPAAVLGAWLAGKSVVPIIDSDPPDRLLRLAKEFNLQALYSLGENARMERIKSAMGAGLAIKRAKAGTALPLKLEKCTPEAVAFFIYTSGSTGGPKRVTVRHRELEHWYRNSRASFHPLRKGEVFLNLFGWSFDAWFEPMLHGLAAGMQVINQNPSGYLRMARDFKQHPPRVLSLTPSQGKFLLKAPGREFFAERLERTIFGGEILSAALAREWREAFPLSTIENSYGPSETTCTVFFHKVGAPSEAIPEAGALPIGRPHPGVEAEVDEEGVLWVRTEQVTGDMRTKGPKGEEGPWFRTGDLVEKNAAGEFTVLGRKDHLVKVHGLRISITEIEAALHDGGLDACVLQLESGELAAVFFLAEDPPKIPAALSWSLKQLPKSVVPRRFYFCPERPWLAAGKTDRQRLQSRIAKGEIEEVTRC